MGESEEQDDLLKQEQGASEQSEEAALRKKKLAELFEELEELQIPTSQVALTIDYSAGTLRNEKISDNPSQNIIDVLEEYINIQKRLRSYFRDRPKDIEPAEFLINEDRGKYMTRQDEILAEVKKGNAYVKAFVKHQIEKEANGNEQLKNETLDQFEQESENQHITPKEHKSSKNTFYLRGKGKPKNDPDQPAPPTEPAL